MATALKTKSKHDPFKKDEEAYEYKVTFWFTNTFNEREKVTYTLYYKTRDKHAYAKEAVLKVMEKRKPEIVSITCY